MVKQNLIQIQMCQICGRREAEHKRLMDENEYWNICDYCNEVTEESYWEQYWDAKAEEGYYDEEY